ncbi:RNA polymerase sigma factor [Porticoccus sp. GXU_MW_L64]
MGKKHDKTTAGSSVTAAFLKHKSFLNAFLRKFMHRPQDIEDIAQEAYLRAFKAEKERDVGHPKTLLFTIAKNVALNELRSKAKRVTGYIEECHSDMDDLLSSTVDEEIEALDGLQSYCKAVDALPEQCRRVYLLRKVHGLQHKDIAERLGITVRSVERHLQKGAIKCRAFLREEESMQKNRSLDASRQQRVRLMNKGRTE